jgi:nucleoside-diphosphate-sugar epimerase
VTHVVHLAALQYPYCRNDHVEGARVNVLGTVCVFDAAVAVGAKLVYSSSIAALADGQLYGTWKRANVGTAAAFWAEDGFPSIGIRPALVYGVGRDRGVTASMTLAMEAAARGEPYHIIHGGSSPLNHAGDLARLFVRAARAVSDGAPVYDAGGAEHDMRDVIDAIEAAAPDARISFEDTPFAATPSGFDGSALEAALGGIEWRPLDHGVRETVERFRALVRR